MRISEYAWPGYILYNDPCDPNDPNDPNDPRDPRDPSDPSDPCDPCDPNDPNMHISEYAWSGCGLEDDRGANRGSERGVNRGATMYASHAYALADAMRRDVCM